MISVNDLSVLLDNSYIIVDLKSKSKDSAINEMLNYAISNGLDINIENVISIINKKETIGNSGLGYGIAFPHIRTKDLEQNKIIFAISREGVDYGSRDNKPVHFIILFLTSLKPSENNKYLSFLSLITRMSRLIMYTVLLIESKTKDEFRNKFFNIGKNILEDK